MVRGLPGPGGVWHHGGRLRLDAVDDRGSVLAAREQHRQTDGACILQGSVARFFVEGGPASDPVQDALDDVTEIAQDVENLLVALPNLNGTNGLVSKLDDAVALINTATAGLLDGSLDEAAAAALYDDARAKIEAFKNQVQGKMNGGNPQISMTEGTELLGAANDLLALIDDLEALL